MNGDSNTAEAYDHVANTWSNMPNMIYGRYDHSLVAVRNKLFVFGSGTETSEVFDSCANKFVLLKPPSSIGFENTTRTLSVGNKILIFKHTSAQLISFDFVKNEWKEEPIEVTKDIAYYTCLKLPKI